jgi:hypothetical protein
MIDRQPTTARAHADPPDSDSWKSRSLSLLPLRNLRTLASTDRKIGNSSRKILEIMGQVASMDSVRAVDGLRDLDQRSQRPECASPQGLGTAPSATTVSQTSLLSSPGAGRCLSMAAGADRRTRRRTERELESQSRLRLISGGCSSFDRRLRNPHEPLVCSRTKRP